MSEQIFLILKQKMYQGGDWYGLSGRVDRDVWEKIKKYFFWGTQYDEERDRSYSIGWVTKEPEKVEEILNIPEELRYKNRKKKAELEKKKKEEEKERDLKIIEEEIKEIQKEFKRLFIDWSWDDYSQSVGKLVKSYNNFDVYEYLVNDNLVGYTLKRKNLAEKYKIPDIKWAKVEDVAFNSNAEKLIKKIFN